MKKFISMVMAAAMVVTMVPATAFAAGTVTGTANVQDAAEWVEKDVPVVSDVKGVLLEDGADTAELQIKVGSVDYKVTDGVIPEVTLNVILDGAEFIEGDGTALEAADIDVDKLSELGTRVAIVRDNTKYEGKTTGAFGSGLEVNAAYAVDDENVTIKSMTFLDVNELEIVISGALCKDDMISIDLASVLDEVTAGHVAYVSLESDICDMEAVAYASVLDYGITATTKKVGVIAEEEHDVLAKDIKIKSNVGDFVQWQVFELKLSKGFEFYAVDGDDDYAIRIADDNVAYVQYKGTGAASFTIDAEDIEIEATTAKAGAECVMTVKALKDTKYDGDYIDRDGTFNAKTTVKVLDVVDYKVIMSVDADEDTPVMWNGVNAANAGLTADADEHWSAEVTIEETFPGAWGMRKGFELNLPAGVYVTNVEVLKADNFFTVNGSTDVPADKQEWYDAMWNAYREGDHLNFVFEKRTFNDVNTTLAADPAKVVFQLELVAEPTFEGDVKLELKGDLLDTQEVTIAKFVAPYTIEAKQNDLKIDYRYTAIDTDIVIKEAEAGLWAKGTTFALTMEDDYMTFEKDATFTVNEASEMTLKDKKSEDAVLSFAVKAISDEEAAEVTISGIELYMGRSLAAGPYALEMDTEASDLIRGFLGETLFAADANTTVVTVNGAESYDAPTTMPKYTGEQDEDTYVDDVDSYDEVVNPAFVNIVTAGREVDDASFTTKVLVPIGESVIYAGDKAYTIPVPAYINADGYTMMPIRAVAVALGIDNDAVQWDDATKTVIVMYGQRFITMTAGQKVIYVSGTALPAKSAVEIVDGRAFLGLRDLATALGVTKIDYVDGVASLN